MASKRELRFCRWSWFDIGAPARLQKPTSIPTKRLHFPSASPVALNRQAARVSEVETPVPIAPAIKAPRPSSVRRSMRPLPATCGGESCFPPCEPRIQSCCIANGARRHLQIFFLLSIAAMLTIRCAFLVFDAIRSRRPLVLSEAGTKRVLVLIGTIAEASGMRYETTQMAHHDGSRFDR
jgi:hypothetical protein